MADIDALIDCEDDTAPKSAKSAAKSAVKSVSFAELDPVPESTAVENTPEECFHMDTSDD